jgi:hypothetical protein
VILEIYIGFDAQDCVHAKHSKCQNPWCIKRTERNKIIKKRGVL